MAAANAHAVLRPSCRACEVAYLAALVGNLAYVAAAAPGRLPLLVGLCERLLLRVALARYGLLAGAVARAA